jgi:hypothetical protein
MKKLFLISAIASLMATATVAQDHSLRRPPASGAPAFKSSRELRSRAMSPNTRYSHYDNEEGCRRRPSASGCRTANRSHRLGSGPRRRNVSASLCGRSTGGNGDDDAYQAAPAEHACSVWLKERANENRCSRIRSELTWPLHQCCRANCHFIPILEPPITL